MMLKGTERANRLVGAKDTGCGERLVIRLVPFRRRRINNPSQGPQELEQFRGSIVFLRERAVDPKQIVQHLLTTADKYRQFAQWIGDHQRRECLIGRLIMCTGYGYGGARHD